MKSVTTTDISTVTGYSVSTVAKVLAGDGEKYNIKEATMQKILDAAEQMGYYRNEAALVMNTGVNNTVAVLGDFVANTAYSVYSLVLSGIMMEAARHGYGVKLLDTSEDLKKSFSLVMGNRIRHIVYMDIDVMRRKQIAELCRKNNIALTFVFEESIDDFPVVRTDDRAGARAAVEYLIACGHRRIALICSAHEPFHYTAIRHSGYLDALESAGIRIDKKIICCQTDTDEICGENIKKLLLLKDRPTAFFCVGDTLAMQVQREGYRLGINIPEELSVIGFSDSEIAIQQAVSPLTSVSQPFQLLGRTAFRQTLGFTVDFPMCPENCCLIPTELKIRESVHIIGKGKVNA